MTNADYPTDQLSAIKHIIEKDQSARKHIIDNPTDQLINADYSTDQSSARRNIMGNDQSLTIPSKAGDAVVDFLTYRSLVATAVCP